MTIRTLLALALSLAAHTGLAEIPEQTLTTNDLKAEQWAPRERAEKLARVGEALMMPQSIDYAVEVFEDALKLDPQNARAGFYLHVFKPLITLKGYLGRVRPLVEATNEAPFITSYYANLNQTWPYFRSERHDIDTDRKMRELMGELGEAWGAARAYLADRATPLALRTTWLTNDYARLIEEPVLTWQWIDGQWVGKPSGETRTYRQKLDGLTLAARHCKVDRPEPGVYHVEACPHLSVRTYQLDFADIEALRGYAAGHQLLGLLDTAYNTDGLMNLGGRSESALKAGRVLSDVEIALPFMQADAGALEPDHKLGRVRELGTDIYGAVKWLKRFQGDLCAKRPGFVFGDGICLTSKSMDESDLKKALALTEATLAGNPIDASNGRGVRTQVRMHRIYDDPVPNLVLIAPNSFNLRGQAVSLPDASLNGIFLNNDAPKFYGLIAQ